MAALFRLSLLLGLLLGQGVGSARAQTPGVPPMAPVPAALRDSLRLAPTPAKYQLQVLMVAKHYSALGDTAATLAYARLGARLARRDHNLTGEALAYDRCCMVYFLQGMLPPALRFAQLSAHCWEGSPQPNGSWAADTQNHLAYVYIKLGRSADALAALNRSYRMFSKLHNERSCLLADNARGALYLKNGLLDSASFYLVRCARGFHRLPPSLENAAQETMALNNLSALYTRRQQPAEALGYSRQVVALRLAFRDSLGLGPAYNNLSNVLLNVDSLAPAWRYARLGVGLARRLGQLDPQAMGHIHLGNCFQRAGQPDSAEAHYLRALAFSRRGGIRTNRGKALLALATLYQARRRPAEALRRAQELEALDSTYREPSITLDNLQLLGQLAQARHDDAAALGYFARQRALEQRQATVQSSQQMAALRMSFGVERTEQQLYLAQARAQAQAQQAQLLRQQREGAYRDTLNRRAQRQQQLLLRQQLLTQQQAAEVAQAGQQVQALTQRSQAQAQQARLQQQELRLAHQQQELARLRTRQQLAGLGGGAALLLLLGGYLFQRYRQRQAQRQAAAAAALRTRLAADLHDDVGNLLTQISMQSGLLRESPLMPVPLLARVEALTSAARRATQQMSDAIWGLAATAPTLPDLLSHMRDHAHEVLQPLGLEPRFDTHPAVPTLPLSAEARQALYLIFKEALHNIVKHAHPTEVLITLAPAHPGLALTVRNDGPAAAVPARPEGQGLASMQTRAAAVGGRVQYPAQAAGFAVEAVVGL